MQISLGTLQAGTSGQTLVGEITIVDGTESPANVAGASLAVYPIGSSSPTTATATLAQIGGVTGLYSLTVTTVDTSLSAGSYSVRFTAGTIGSGPSIPMAGNVVATFGATPTGQTEVACPTAVDQQCFSSLIEYGLDVSGTQTAHLVVISLDYGNGPYYTGWSNDGTETGSISVFRSGANYWRLLTPTGTYNKIGGTVGGLPTGAYTDGSTVTASSNATCAAALAAQFGNASTPLPTATSGTAGGLALVGSQVDLVNAPNATAVTAIQLGLSKPNTPQAITGTPDSAAAPYAGQYGLAASGGANVYVYPSSFSADGNVAFAGPSTTIASNGTHWILTGSHVWTGPVSSGSPVGTYSNGVQSNVTVAILQGVASLDPGGGAAGTNAIAASCASGDGGSLPTKTNVGSPMQAGATVKATDGSGEALATHADAESIIGAIAGIGGSLASGTVGTATGSGPYTGFTCATSGITGVLPAKGLVSVNGMQQVFSAVISSGTATFTFETPVTTQPSGAWTIGAWTYSANPASPVFNVLPGNVVAASGQVKTSLTPAWQNSYYSTTFPVIDASGSPIDLSGVSLEMSFWDPNDRTNPPATTCVAKTSGTPHATIAVGGTNNNMVTLTLDTTVTAATANWQWLLRPAANNATPYTSGKLSILAAPAV